VGPERFGAAEGKRMSEPPFEPFTVELAPFPSIMKQPSAFLAMPDRLTRLIGQIILTWGAFELAFDALLSTVLKANSTEQPFTLWSFPKRRALMEKESNTLFAKRVWIRDYLQKLLTDCTEIHSNRNLLVHGKFSIKIQTGQPENGILPGTVTLVCLGKRHGQQIIKSFSDGDIENLFVNLAHLNGRIESLTKNDPLLAISSRDRRFLEAFLAKDYQRPAIPVA
jgi:hypothetical protein